MGQKDAAEKILEDYQDVFADILNVLVFQGKKRWKTSKSLKERIHVPKALEGYVSDYRANIFEISYLSEQQIAMFRSDFQIVADYFVQMRKNQGYKENKKIIRHVDAMLKFLSVFTGDQDYEKLKLSKDQGGINMCVVLQEAIERGRKQGIECGKKEGIEFGIREGIERGRREGIEFGIREGVERGKREGIEFGIQQGRADAMLEIASGMLRKNISIKDICELTGLSEEQVRVLELELF